MMSRASRLLKWIGAGTVLFTAAPTAYADGARHTGPQGTTVTTQVSAPTGLPHPDRAQDADHTADTAHKAHLEHTAHAASSDVDAARHAARHAAGPDSRAR